MRHAAFLLTLLFAATAQAESHWNQYRGPRGDGHSDAKGLPLTFGETQNVVWKTPIAGKAWSSPVIWGSQIWLTTATPDGKKMWAVCVNFDTGKIEKEILAFENEKPQFCHDLNSYATPTPVVEEGRVYVHFGVHGTACIDTKTGEKIWERRDLPCNHFRGPASSPIVHGDLLYLTFDGYDLQYIAALEKKTGKDAWKKNRAFDFKTSDGDAKKAYCTPMVIEHDGKQQLICPAAVATEAFDPRTGELLWTVRHGGMNASARPIYSDGLLFLTNGMGRMVVVKPEGKGDISKSIVWESSKAIPKKSSPLLIGDLLFMVSDQGVAACVEAKTGNTYWNQRLPGGEHAASPVYVDGRIYFFSMDGVVPVIEPAKEYKLLATNKLGDGFMASPAIAGKSFVLRSKTALYRVEQK